MISAMLAMAEREARRELSDLGRLLFDVVWPLVVLVVLGFGVDAFSPPKAEFSYVAFLGPGVLGLLLLRRTLGTARSLEREARHGFREYLVTPVARQWIVAGSLAGVWAVHAGIALMVLAASAFFIPAPAAGFWLAALSVVASTAASISLGLVFSVAVDDVRRHTRLTSLALLVAALVSGIFFPVSDLPFSLQYLSLISPWTYMVDSIRGFLTGVSFLPPLAGLAVTAIIAFVCLTIGAWRSRALFRV